MFETLWDKKQVLGNSIIILFPRLFQKRPLYFKSQLRPTRKVFVYKIQVNPIHTILKYGEYYAFVDR